MIGSRISFPTASTSLKQPAPGNAARMRTRTASCDSTSPRAATSASIAQRSFNGSPTGSTADPGKRSTGPPRPSSFTRTWHDETRPLLRRQLESTLELARRHGVIIHASSTVISYRSHGARGTARFPVSTQARLNRLQRAVRVSIGVCENAHHSGFAVIKVVAVG